MFERIKAILGNDGNYYALLLVLMGVAAFGLGRLSVTPVSGLAQNQASVVLTKSASREFESARNEVSPIPQSEGSYVASKSGAKYHLPWCPGAKQMKEENKIWFTSKAQAEAAGYTAAANCKGL